ncbi:MAG: tetratricopeptide repeat protein [Synechococcaceae cyanobacterium SM2_3_1]|nr:tetratricopeptide repeat protein [Synechococcaceae cyanobacterium SM2_3_1]
MIESSKDAKIRAELFIKKGEILLGEGSYEQALGCWDQALELAHDDYNILLPLGRTLLLNERPDRAIIVFQETLKLYETPEVYLQYGISLLYLGRIDEALACFERGLTLKPENSALWRLHGVTLGNLGRHEEALASFDRGLSLKSDDPDLWRLHGATLLNLGRYEEGLISCCKGLEFKHDDLNLLTTYGDILFNMDRYVEAKQALRDAVQVSPMMELHEFYWLSYNIFTMSKKMRSIVLKSY